MNDLHHEEQVFGKGIGRAVRRSIALFALVCAAVVAAPVAAGAHGDPQDRHTPGDTAKAHSIALERGDLPGGAWEAERDGADVALLRCAGFAPDLSDLVETGEAESPNFTRPPATFVSSTASLFATEAQANAAFDRVVKPGLMRCLARILEDQSEAQVTIRVVSAGPVAHPSGGDELRACRLRARASAKDDSVPIVVDLVLFRAGRATVAFVAGGVAEGLPTGDRRSLVATLVRRANAAGR